MLKKIAGRFARFLCRHRGTPLVDGLERLCHTFHRALNNVDFNMARNGERRVLQLIAARQPGVLFDVGANTGEWALLASALSPTSAIHAFEIVPSTYAALSEATKHLAQIVPVHYGLADKEGTIAISLGKDHSTASACKIDGMAFHNAYYTQQIEGKVRKACDYMRENDIQGVDFVKIDVEGMDFKVIQGFGDRIKQVRALQFEYGIFNIASHDLLADFCNYLTQKGFVVGKIFPRHVHFFEYHFDMENFHGSNYLAIRADETDLIAALKGGR